MVKKTKLAKSRLDKYYNLAKEQGYRARSAYKLIQISKKYNIFKDCNILIDLCAAPGGWLQVASNVLPINSLIIGVDLVPIKPIKNVITLQMDITSQNAKQVLQKHVKGSKVDVILHDGSPNMGSNWNLDAFNQNQLVLSATNLACNLLRKGGTFVTKVFRSSEYSSLIWVFQELFNVVKATKPQSSRSVSAEIFVVCMQYKAPQFLDLKLFDIKYVFKNRGLTPMQSEDPEKSRSLSHLLKLKKQNKRQGYSEGDDYREATILEFLKSDNPSNILVNYNKITFDRSETCEMIRRHPETNDEIMILINDLQVLGKRDLLLLLKWRMRLLRAIRNEGLPIPDLLAKLPKIEELPPNDLEVNEDEGEDVKVGEGELAASGEKIRERMTKSMKKRQRKFLENLNSGIQISQNEDGELFSNIVDSELLMDIESEIDEDNDEDESYIPLDINNDHKIEEELEMDYVIQKERVRIRAEKAMKKAKKRELIYDEQIRQMNNETKKIEMNNQVNRWFNQDIFELEDEVVSDIVEEVVEGVEVKGEVVKGDVDEKNPKPDNIDESVGEREVDEAVDENAINEKKAINESRKLHNESDSIELIGPLLISKKSRIDLMDGLYNRYTFHEDYDDLPIWFREDEDIHTRVELPLTKEQMDIYRMKLREIKSMPIKKVREAISRRMKKVKSRLDKVRLDTERISSRDDVSVMHQITKNKKILKKVTKEAKGKKNKVYVVSNRMGSMLGKKSGDVIKIVDRRMKKDKRNLNKRRRH